MEVLIIILCYNEREHICNIIGKVKEYTDADILVIDDGSTDGSTELIRQIEGIHTIFHEENRGYGATLIEGFSYAIKHNYKHALTIDCDEQHQPSYIPKLINRIKGGDADILSGSRYLKKELAFDSPPQDRKRINEKITRKINQITGYRLTDSFCGFKAYKVDALKRLNLSEEGYGMPLQLWIQAAENKLKVEEIPVPLIYKEPDRSFGEELDDPEKRYRYYMSVIEEELC